MLSAIAVVALLAVSPLAAQQPPPPATSAEDVERKFTVLEQAIADAQRLGLERQLADALCAIGETFQEKALYTAARMRALSALAIYEKLSFAAGIGRANLLLGAAANRSGDDAEAESRARRAMAAYDATGDRRGRAQAALVVVRAVGRRRDDTRQLDQQAIADARAAGDRALEAAALQSYGDSLFNAASYEQALDTLSQAASILQEIDNRPALARVYNSLGRLYRAHGRGDEALKFQLKALELHEASGSPQGLMQGLNAVAVTYEGLGNIAKARPYLERALEVAERSNAALMLDFLRSNMVDMMMADGDYAGAARLLEGVLARQLDPFPANRMRALSRAYLMLSRRDDALALAEKAVSLCGKSGEDLDCLYSFDQRAAVNAARGDIDAALADVNRALEKIDEVRAKLVPADFFKRQFTYAQEDIFSRAIGLQLARGHGAAALEIAERARARAFVDLLASKDLNPRATPQSARADAANLPSGVEASAASTSDLVAAARRLRSTVLAYWVSRDAIFIWVFDASGEVRSAQVDIRRSRLTELVRAVGLQTAKSDAWRELYRLLVRPVRGALPRTRGALVTIVPHGPLSALTFAALQDERGRYLLEDYTLHYVPAGAVLPFTAARKLANAREGSMLVVADPVPPSLSKLDAPLPRLPGARAEARAIARVKSPARITSLEGNTASESAVRSGLAGKAVLHFATHAIVNDDDPFGSFLALKPEPDKGGDGLLTAREIYGFDLEADLVVLSACRSAGGRVTGDGIAAFTRAFIYAGTASLIASLWDVADEPTNRLLPDFYRAWLSGQSKARALRQAQLGLLRELRAGRVRLSTPAGVMSLPEHPVFWAGFALFGEPD